MCVSVPVSESVFRFLCVCVLPLSQGASKKIESDLKIITKLQASVESWKSKIASNEREYTEKCVTEPMPVLSSVPPGLLGFCHGVVNCVRYWS